MPIKVRDLVKKLKTLDPESLVYLENENNETEEIHVINLKDSVILQSNTIDQPDDYRAITFPEDIQRMYPNLDQLVLFLHRACTLSHIPHLTDPTFTGEILVDRLFSMGDHVQRFVQLKIQEGKLITARFVKVNRIHPIRRFSRQCIMEEEHRLEQSVLNPSQKKHIRHGVAI